MSHLQQGTQSGAIPKQTHKNDSPIKGDDETMDPDTTREFQSQQTLTSSHVSMRSDQSVNSSDDGDQTMDGSVHQRPESPTFTYVSMKSDRSMETPITFKGDSTRYEVDLKRPDSPTPSCQSMKSDRSMEPPLRFNERESTGKKISSTRPGDVLCDICSERRAVKTCLTCSVSYCETDVKQHYTVPKLQTHTLVDVAEEQRWCQDHHRPLEVFCRTDQILICSLCVVTKHRGHDTVYEEIKQPGRQITDEEQDQRQNLVEVLRPPGEIRFLSVKSDSVCLCWGPPEGLNGPQRFRVIWRCDGEQNKVTVKDMYQIEIKDLKPGKKYEFDVSTEGDNGSQSRCSTASVFTVVPAPKDLKIDQSGATSFTLHWTKAQGLEQIQQSFLISVFSSRAEPKAITTHDCSRTFSDLRLSTEYTIQVSTVLNGRQSEPVSITIYTKPPAPDQLSVDSVDTTSATVSWSQPQGMDQTHHKYQISYHCPGRNQDTATTSSHSITLSDLQPATEYSVTVCTKMKTGEKSQPVSITFTTIPPAPDQLSVDSVDTTSATVSWSQPQGMDQTHHEYQISYHCPGNDQDTTTTSLSITLSDLQPATEYSVTVCTKMKTGEKSQPVSTTFTTRFHLMELLSKAGLQDHYENKLTLSTVLEINANTTSDEPLQTMQSLPGAYLKKLMMTNVSARSVKCIETDTDNSNVIHPLDLITAVLLCSDGLLQQEIVLKMSMCQFAVPFLLPNCETGQSTLMLWAMRDIVKTFKTSSQAATQSLIEERIVQSDIPMVSFVRMGKSSLSKSQILNKLLSNPQQCHNTFVHHDMEGGDVPRKMSNGLVEVSWYLPCGNKNIDRFTEPLAVANLRGDMRSFETQFSFLCQASAAVYIFSDGLDSDFFKMLNKNVKAELFLVSERKLFRIDTLKEMITNCGMTTENVIVKKDQNDAGFIKTLQLSVGDIIEKGPNKLTMEKMAQVASQSGILVDEHCDDCQTARRMADAITSNISNTVKFKEDQLPLQGQIWKEISQLEKEMCRLLKAGKEEIEHYKSSLRTRVRELRNKQQNLGVNDAMTNFIKGMSSSRITRSYFLKWMRLNLENLSWKNLSGLKERYKDLQQNPQTQKEKDIISDLDKQISDSSLGLEHFLRELGQLYECVSSLPKNSPQRKQMEHLPGLCAQMLLDGFPIELVDGDASNIPLKWISDVLTQLHTLVQSNSKIQVVTVLGVQSSGKSTLLNTMFGVQFAVSSGRCTRGAFMLLMNVNKELKEELGCDFIIIIDTEGLKSPELAQLDDSYEHDNELATLVIGLSDVTIINVAMENSTEMRDILQIVVHAFLRMKDAGKKPLCHFVHQNVSDMAAYRNNMTGRKKFLEQLDEVTLAAARMENKENITKFTDMIEFDPDTSSCYIPGLWYGTPPMAPVNAGYSEAVYDFKKTLMQDFFKNQENHDMIDFLKWTKCLSEAVKFEKFVFSFRNSLVADAYTSICIEYNSWDWSFQKNMYTLILAAENTILNSNPQITIRDNLNDLERTLFEEISKGEKEIEENIEKYFKKQDGNVKLVEKYKEGFVIDAKRLIQETKNTMKDKLHRAVEIKEGMAQLEHIKSSQASTMEKEVLNLLQKCKQKNTVLSDEALGEEFENMWKRTLSKLDFRELPTINVAQNAFSLLRQHVSTRGSHVNYMLVDNPLVNCGKEAFVVPSSGSLHMSACIPAYRNKDHHKSKVQSICNNIISQCQDLITQTVDKRADYYDTCIKELLTKIDKALQPKKGKVNEECEISLKLHICGIAVTRFQKMHDDFVAHNNPQKCLEKSKDKYYEAFTAMFHERDQCQKTAEDTMDCLRPAVQEYVTKMIGPEIVDKVKEGEGSEDYSTRGAFQFSILEQLLTDGEYDKYDQYITDYETFVKKWLLDKIVDKLSKENSVKELEKKSLSMIVERITASILTTKTSGVNDIKNFIGNLRRALEDKLDFLKHPLDSITLLTIANTESFSDYLTKSVKEMEQLLAAEYDQTTDIREKLTSLPFKPQDKIFSSLFGCGKQCPFCGTPCEAGGGEHTKHWSTIHCSTGLRHWRYISNQMLLTDICSSLVISNQTFKNKLTENIFKPYKDYQTYYPDWIIEGDASISASDYWKYVMATFNERIAERHAAKPAVIPGDWKTLTKDDAMNSLKLSFNRK